MLPTVLTLLPAVRLNSVKMCPTTSQAEQLRVFELSRSLMKCRTAVLTCQGSIEGVIFQVRRQREATCSSGQPLGTSRDNRSRGGALAPEVRARP